MVHFGMLQEQGAVRGDVMGDELAEQWPSGGDAGIVAAFGEQSAVAGTLPPAETDQKPLVGGERCHLRKQPPVLAAHLFRGRVDAPCGPLDAAGGCQAVIPGDGRVRDLNDHGRSSFVTPCHGTRPPGHRLHPGEVLPLWCGLSKPVLEARVEGEGVRAG